MGLVGCTVLGDERLALVRRERERPRDSRAGTLQGTAGQQRVAVIVRGKGN